MRREENPQPKPKAVNVHMSALRNLHRKAKVDIGLKQWVMENPVSIIERYAEKFDKVTFSPKTTLLLNR